LRNVIFRYEKAITAMAKQAVTLEVLSYHASAPLEEAYQLRVSSKKHKYRHHAMKTTLN